MQRGLLSFSYAKQLLCVRASVHLSKREDSITLHPHSAQHYHLAPVHPIFSVFARGDTRVGGQVDRRERHLTQHAVSGARGRESRFQQGGSRTRSNGREETRAAKPHCWSVNAPFHFLLHFSSLFVRRKRDEVLTETCISKKYFVLQQDCR